MATAPTDGTGRDILRVQSGDVVRFSCLACGHVYGDLCPTTVAVTLHTMEHPSPTCRIPGVYDYARRHGLTGEAP